MKKLALIFVFALTMIAFVNAQGRVEIKKEELPKAITESIQKDFTGSTIESAYKVNKDNQMSYEVVVAKGADKQKLLYNSSGAFVKKEAIQSTSVQKSEDKKAPATKN